jgi:hypothetical protein
LVLEVADLRADPVPAHVFLAVRAFHGAVAQNAHAFIIQGVGLRKVKDVETDYLALADVRDSEEVPLSVAVSVDVILKDQIVLTVGDLDGS